MKTSFMKIVLPALILMTGVLSAFDTSANADTAEQASVWGYRKIVGSPQPCERIKMCDQVPNFVCKSTAGENLYQLIAPNNCPTLLFHSVNN